MIQKKQFKANYDLSQYVNNQAQNTINSFYEWLSDSGAWEEYNTAGEAHKEEIMTEIRDAASLLEFSDIADVTNNICISQDPEFISNEYLEIDQHNVKKIFLDVINKKVNSYIDQINGVLKNNMLRDSGVIYNYYVELLSIGGGGNSSIYITQPTTMEFEIEYSYQFRQVSKRTSLDEPFIGESFTNRITNNVENILFSDLLLNIEHLFDIQIQNDFQNTRDDLLTEHYNSTFRAFVEHIMNAFDPDNNYSVNDILNTFKGLSESKVGKIYGAVSTVNTVASIPKTISSLAGKLSSFASSKNIISLFASVSSNPSPGMTMAAGISASAIAITGAAVAGKIAYSNYQKRTSAKNNFKNFKPF